MSSKNNVMSKLEVLNAQVDLNTDKSLLLSQQEIYKNTQIRLNELLARDLLIDFKWFKKLLLKTIWFMKT